MPRALITGITGQDGSYLAELLLAKGYEVHGLVRRTSQDATGRIAHLLPPAAGRPPLLLHDGDLTDAASLAAVVRAARPDEVYNLAAQSHVGLSFAMPEATANVVGLGALRLLDALRQADRPARLYQASSSEMFGDARESPQNEATPFNPQSPYAAAKLFAHQMTAAYRRGYGLFACNGILFNHESPRRGPSFVTRKVTRGVADIVAGRADRLTLGNLDARRDWGYAPEYVEAMWQMLQQDAPDDYVVATGETHSVRDFVALAFGLVGLDWRDHVRVDPAQFRVNEVPGLRGDAAKARSRLGWQPRTRFPELVRLMLEADLDGVEGSRSRGVEKSESR